MSTTVLRLAAEGSLDLGPLVTHLLPDSDAAVAFEMLDRDPQDALQVVLDYGTAG
jgi:threonine dehydrogenase-like Zn-dependent dehydrogenase